MAKISLCDTSSMACGRGGVIEAISSQKVLKAYDDSKGW
jgi:hypothetical protein